MNNDWPHAPVHRLDHAGTYFITGATHYKQPIYNSAAALTALQSLLFTNVREHDCVLQAWSLFPNHYHLVVSADDGDQLRRMLGRFHAEAAITGCYGGT